MTLREYQKRPTAKIIDYFNSKATMPKLAIFPTGWGKSHLIAHVIKEIGKPFLIIQPSKELLEQNIEKYRNLGEEATIYSASLDSKKASTVTFATIGSIKGKADVFIDLGVKNVIIDEADKFPTKGGMLNTFLAQLGAEKVLGITATPLKLLDNSGKGQKKIKIIINQSKRYRLYDDIIHVSQVQELVDGGYWSPLVYQTEESDTSFLEFNTVGTDYTEISMREFYDRNNLRGQVMGAMEKLTDRKSFLIFVPSIEEALALENALPECKAIVSGMKKSLRTKYVKDYKEGKIRGLISINALAVGFDHPGIDCIICARPTASISWYIQALGRGVRIKEGKKDCLIVDFTKNYDKFGKIEEMFYSKNSTWELYGKGNKKLSNYNPKISYGTVTTPQEEKLRKNNIMPFGRFQGLRVKNLPYKYIQFLVESNIKIYDASLRAELLLRYEQIKYY